MGLYLLVNSEPQMSTMLLFIYHDQSIRNCQQLMKNENRDVESDI